MTKKEETTAIQLLNELKQEHGFDVIYERLKSAQTLITLEGEGNYHDSYYQIGKLRSLFLQLLLLEKGANKKDLKVHQRGTAL